MMGDGWTARERRGKGPMTKGKWYMRWWFVVPVLLAGVALAHGRHRGRGERSGTESPRGGARGVQHPHVQRADAAVVRQHAHKFKHISPLTNRFDICASRSVSSSTACFGRWRSIP